jgi:hypothetical protein
MASLLMRLRYFYEEMPDLHIIAAGSLLDFILKDISFPVGRVQFIIGAETPETAQLKLTFC